MKCSYCGAPIEKGRVFCLNCGEEVQWVPEYHPIGSYRMNASESEIVSEEVHYQEPQSKPIDNNKYNEKPPKKKRPVLIGIILLLIAVIILLALKGYMEHKNYNSFDYQFNMAETSFSNQDYDTALEYIDRAVTLMPENEESYLLKSQILFKQGESLAAETILFDLIQSNPDNITAYSLLINYYDSQSDYDSLKSLIMGITSDAVKNRYAAYYPIEVYASHEQGEYEELITVELFTESEEGCIVYYTLDGSDPMLMRNVYESGIELEEGSTTIRAVAVNDKHIIGEVKSYTYEITLPTPDIPLIMPVSGEYDAQTNVQITVEVPTGCTAYYAFDEKPTLESNKYTEPVEMLEGEHTFYVILVNEYGKESYPGSATYILKEGIS